MSNGRKTLDEPSVVLSAKGLTKQFAGFVAVDNVNLSIRRGTIHALIGPNGAGKTTVFNLLTKFLTPTSGTVLFRGQDISGASPADVARMGLARSFQISSVLPKLSVLENVRVALQRPAGLAYQFWRSDKSLAVLNTRAEEFIASVGLAESRDTLAAELPYGRKRALELATTLALEPEVLLLDEPMSGMAHEDIKTIVNLIRKAAVGRTVLMVEHNLSVVSDLCDRITVLQRGRVLAEGRFDEVSRDPEVRRAYIGEEDD